MVLHRPSEPTRVAGHLSRRSRGPWHQASTRAPACGRQAAARGSEGGAWRGSNGSAEELSVKSQKPPTCKTGVMGHAAGSPGTTWRYSWLVYMSGLRVDRNEQCRCPLRFPTEVATELLGQLSRAQTRLYYQTERIVVMGKAKLILGLAVLALAVIAGWPIASCELANFELHEDMRDLAADYKVRVKLLGFSFTFHFTPSSAK